jgi:hypothetical protein
MLNTGKAFVALVFMASLGCGGAFEPAAFDAPAASETETPGETKPGRFREHPEDQGPYRAVDLARPVNRALLTALKAMNVTTIIRYYDHANETLPQKTIRAHELALIDSFGMDLAVVFQHHNNRLTSFTPERGQKDAQRSLELAAAIKQPRESVIYFGVDGGFGQGAGEYQKIKNYFIAAAPIIRAAGYRIGAYGSGLNCRRLTADLLADLCWLANARGWPEYDRFLNSGRWTLQQGLPQEIAGFDVDVNLINPLFKDFGQFTIR